MATGRLTDIIKARRESGEGVASSLVGGFKERLKEKFDLRRALPQGGLLTALFPKLSSYKAQGLVPKKDEMSSDTKPGIAAGDSVASLKPLFLSIEKSTKTISKNNASLVSIEKDTNLMKQTLSAIVKVMSGRKNPFASTEDTVPSKLPDEPKNDDGIISTILSAVASIKLLIESVIGFIRNIIGTFVKNFLPILRTISQFALRFRPLLGSLPVLITALAALGVFAAFKLGQFLSQKVAEEVPNMNVLSPKSAANVLKESSKRNLIEFASKAAGRKTPFTHEEAINYLKDQVENGAIYAEQGIKLVDEKTRLEGILKSKDKDKIKAEGGEDSIKEKIGKLKTKIMDLGGEKKLREIIKETSSGPKLGVPKDEDIPSLSPEDKSKVGTSSYNRKDQNIKNRTFGFGDEITTKLIQEGQLGGNLDTASFNAKSPTAVLASIESYAKKNAKIPNILENKTIFLSTGFENSEGLIGDLPIVEKQISILKSLGASDNAIKLIGVTEKSKNATEINAGLSEIASRNHNEFIPIQNKKLGKKYIHF